MPTPRDPGLLKQVNQLEARVAHLENLLGRAFEVMHGDYGLRMEAISELKKGKKP